MLRALRALRALLLLLGSLAAAAGCAQSRPAARAPSINVEARAAASALTLRLAADGRVSSLGEMTRGRVALVNFWASWCEACKEEVPVLRRLHAAYAPHGVAVVGVNVGEPVAQAAAFVRAHRLAFPNLVDERQALVESLGVSGVPTTLVMDADGTIVHVGKALDRAALAKLRELVARRRNLAASAGK